MAAVLTDDRELWDAALRADPCAFAALFDRHRVRVFRHAARLVAAHDADEVMAAAFFELWRRRAEVRLVEDSVLPWLLATATNLCRNRTRGLLRYRALLARLPHETAPDPAELASDREDERRRRDRLLQGLRQLRPVDAALLVLTQAEGLTPTAAGRALGLTATNARTRLQRARARLRALLPDLEPEADPLAEGRVR